MTYIDHRPVWIVDGQHRTRGMVLNHRGAEMDVPVIILHGYEGGVDLTAVAKIFTEINTLAEPLEYMQEHYLAHKFSIPSGDPLTTYGVPEEGLDEQDVVNRRANRMAYKLACMLGTTKMDLLRVGFNLPTEEGLHCIQNALKKWHEDKVDTARGGLLGMGAMQTQKSTWRSSMPKWRHIFRLGGDSEFLHQ